MAATMGLKLIVPTEILVDQPVGKIIAEAENGYFCLLPRHIDFASALAAGIFYFTGSGGEESFFAINRGILVKCGDEVRVSAGNAVRGAGLEDLKDLIAGSFLALDEHERSARSALSRLELGTIRRFMELKEGMGG